MHDHTRARGRTRLARRAFAWYLLLPLGAFAQSNGGPYRIEKEAIGAGIEASAGSYSLVGTAIQPIAFVQSGGTYELIGGMHPLLQGAGDPLLCDGFEDMPCP